MENLSVSTRRYDLDWLRVLAFGLLIFYHCGMGYVAEWGFHIYILHQTITIALVYYMLDWNAGVVVKFLLAVVGTFGISFLWYEFIIRRVRFLHPFFGLK